MAIMELFPNRETECVNLIRRIAGNADVHIRFLHSDDAGAIEMVERIAAAFGKMPRAYRKNSRYDSPPNPEPRSWFLFG
jgi:hypothetical protein